MTNAFGERFSLDITPRLKVLLDLVGHIFENSFLKRQLSLIGGSAIHLVHSSTPQPTRLTLDADFNFRDERTVPDKKDLRELRNQVDKEIIEILRSMGATDDHIFIQPTYPLTRIGARLMDEHGNYAEALVEIGYTKRVPLLEDRTYTLTYRNLTVMTPVPEELYAGKLAALLSRATSRDLFDVWAISRREFDRMKFRKCFIVESLASLSEPFYQLDVTGLLNSIHLDTRLKSLLPIGEDDVTLFETVRSEAMRFIQALTDDLNPEERKGIKQFYEDMEFNREVIDPDHVLHEKVDQYPALLWKLQKLRKSESGIEKEASEQ